MDWRRWRAMVAAGRVHSHGLPRCTRPAPTNRSGGDGLEISSCVDLLSSAPDAQHGLPLCVWGGFRICAGLSRLPSAADVTAPLLRIAVVGMEWRRCRVVVAARRMHSSLQCLCIRRAPANRSGGDGVETSACDGLFRPRRTAWASAVCLGRFPNSCGAVTSAVCGGRDGPALTNRSGGDGLET